MIAAHSAVAYDALACAALLVVAFVAAGFAQTAWLGSRLSRPLAIPLDGGAMWRGQRILGDHKTVRGFLVLPGVVALMLASLGPAATARGVAVWPLDAVSYGVLGLAAGLGFMLGELPNSFLKRRLGVAPGATAPSGALRSALLVTDRVDSILGLLVTVSLLVPTPWVIWVLLLGPGALLHLLFSALLHLRGVKARSA